MSRYILIRRLRVPAFLLLIGVLALLHTFGLLDHFWRLFWPLAFILAGSILLAERFALNAEGFPQMPYPGSPYSGAPYSGAPYPGAPVTGVSPYPAQPDPQQTEQSTAIVPAVSHDLDKSPDGGQS
jgi:hypothetical protein